MAYRFAANRKLPTISVAMPAIAKVRLLLVSFVLIGPSPVGGRTRGDGFTIPGTPTSDQLVGAGVIPGLEVAVGVAVCRCS